MEGRDELPAMHAALARGAAAGPEALVEACALEAGGRIPPRLRGQVYAAILGVQLTGGEQLSEAIASGEATLSNKRVLRVDCDRTRQGITAFQTDGGKARLARLLSFFCKCQATPYRQGLNEVVAPLLMLGADGTEECADGSLTDLSDSAVHRLLQGMVTTFLPAAYGADDDFVGLQCSLEYVRLLLVFHDPELARILQQHSVTPELFATPWLFTLLARGHSLPIVYSLWDALVLHLATPRSAAVPASSSPADSGAAATGSESPMPHSGVHVGPGLLHFLCVAMLVRRRAAIQALVLESASAGAGAALARDIQAAELSVLVSRLSLSSVDEAEELSRLAVSMAAATPDSVRRHLLDVAYAVAPPAQGVLRELVVSVCVRVSAFEALTRAAGAAEISAAASSPPVAAVTATAAASSTGSPSAATSPPLLLVVDCRPMPEFAASHIRGSFHLDPSVLHNPAMLTDMAAAFEDLSSFHFAVLGSGTHAELVDSDSDRRAAGPAPPGAVDAAHVVVMFLLNRGFGHVCEVRGGFGAVEEAVKHTPELGKFLVQDASARGNQGDEEAPGGAPLYDDGSSDGSADDEDDDDDDSDCQAADEGEDAEDDADEVASKSGSKRGTPSKDAGSGSSTPVARRRRAAPKGASSKGPRRESTAGRAMRLLRRLSKPRPSDEHTGPLRLSSEVQPTINTAWADGQHRAGSGRIRRWLAGRAAPTEVFTTSASPDDPPSKSPSGDEASLAPTAPAPATAGRGGRSGSTTTATTGLFAGLKVAGQRPRGATAGSDAPSVASDAPAAAKTSAQAPPIAGRSRRGTAESAASVGSSVGRTPAQHSGLAAELATDHACVEAQLDAMVALAEAPRLRDTSLRSQPATSSTESASRASSSTQQKGGASGAAGSEEAAGPPAKPGAAASSPPAPATTGEAAAEAAPAAPAAGSSSFGTSWRGGVAGWRSAIGSAAASVASMAASRAAAAAAPPRAATSVAGAGGLEAGSFVEADAGVDALDTVLSLVYKGAGGAAAPGGDASEALGPRTPAFFGMRAVRSEEGRPEGAGWAAADADGEVFVGAAEGTGSLLRVVGCRRVFADERVERRVAIFTRRWACFLRVQVGDGPELEGAGTGKKPPPSLFSSLAAQAAQAAARAAGLPPAVRLSVDELLPSRSVAKLKGKKGLANLAIVDFAEPSHDATGAPASKRIVLLCDELRELVEALRSSRK